MELNGLFEVFVIGDKQKVACRFLLFNELFISSFFIKKSTGLGVSKHEGNHVSSFLMKVVLFAAFLFGSPNPKNIFIFKTES